jgi:hypothetical protein
MSRSHGTRLDQVTLVLGTFCGYALTAHSSCISSADGQARCRHRRESLQDLKHIIVFFAITTTSPSRMHGFTLTQRVSCSDAKREVAKQVWLSKTLLAHHSATASSHLPTSQPCAVRPRLASFSTSLVFIKVITASLVTCRDGASSAAWVAHSSTRSPLAF